MHSSNRSAYYTYPRRLMKGSVAEGMSGVGRAERPKTLRGRLRNVYEPNEDASRSSDGSGTTSNPTPASVSAQEKSLAILSPFDEQEEWAKINEIMASFGTGLVRESVFVTELEKEFQARLSMSRSESTVESPCSVGANAMTSVHQWLTSLGLVEYESSFVDYGFDHLDFVNGVLEERHLQEMGITSEKDRQAILESSRNLPCKVRDAFIIDQNNVEGGSGSGSGVTNNNGGGGGSNCSDSDDTKRNRNGSAGNVVEPSDRNGSVASERNAVDDWLIGLRLEQYRDTFRRHLYTDMHKVKGVWDVELVTVLEIEKPAHRQRILGSLSDDGGASNGRPSRPPPPNNDDINADLNQLKNNILQQLKEEIKVKLPPASQHSGNTNTTGTASNTGTLRHSHKKSRPAPPPPPGAAAVDLEIRAPSELLVGVPATLTTQWRHRPQTLLAGQVTYVASYLGSTVVRDMRGTESTKKSIQKLKKSTTSNEDKVIPEIILSISYRGVRFFNAVNQELVCEHEIRNIHCACQDAEDLTHFAYITKDHASKSHYCHVFCVQTMDQATEVILTLGQAFEVAYQMALRENFGTVNRMSGNNGHMRSRSVNQIGNRQLSTQQSPITTQPINSNSHARSHSVNEIKVIDGSILTQHRDNGVNHQVTTPTSSASDRRAPIVMTEDI